MEREVYLLDAVDSSREHLGALASEAGLDVDKDEINGENDHKGPRGKPQKNPPA